MSKNGDQSSELSSDKEGTFKMIQESIEENIS